MRAIEDASAEQPAPPDESVSPIMAVHYLLRGRYQWAIPLALVCGLVCALVCSILMKSNYSSTGTLRVRPTLPRALVDSDENGEMPMYQAFVDMQATLLTSEKLADLAAQDPDWVAIAGPASPATAGRLVGSLKVSHDGGELINVVCSDRDPKAAVVGVHAIISNYIKLYSEDEEAARQDHKKMLQNVEATASARLADLSRECLAIAAKYGSTNLDALVEFKMLELSDMRKNARQLGQSLSAVENGADPSTQPGLADANSPEMWALNDREMGLLLDRQRDAEMTLQANKQVLGENNPTLRANEFAVQMVKQEIQRRAEFLAKNSVQGLRPGGGGIVETPASIEGQKRALDADIANASAELGELGKSNVRLKEITNEQTALQAQLTETGRSIEELESENLASGRIDVISYGDRAQLQTGKRLLAAAAGGSLGFVGTLGVLILAELRHRRLNQISDVMPGAASANGLTILGALPVISERPVAYNEGVAYAVHKIRAHLQLHAGRKDQRTLAITSPLSGDGKTSMVVALGMSFAGSGCRTLLIDSDLIGGGLTARFDVKVQQSIADLVRRHTEVSEGELAHAWEVSRAERSDLLDKLVEFRFLDSDAASQIKKRHEESSLGILDAMAGEKLSDCVGTTRWPNLFILPRGNATAEDVSRLSPRAFRNILQQARASYEMVLIDTGPISGSIEATLAISEADGAILVVSRGGAAADVRRAVNEVQAAGGNLLGIIFNRAKPKDMVVNGFSSSVRSQAQYLPNGSYAASSGAVASALVRSSPATSWERRFEADEANQEVPK